MSTGYTVLFIDDNETFLRHATRFVERDPRLRVVGTARRVAEGLTTAKRLHPDVILLDLSMPERGGIEAIADFREAAPEARIIILTMQEADMYRDAALQHGADGIVSKSNMASDLVATILREPSAR